MDNNPIPNPAQAQPQIQPQPANIPPKKSNGALIIVIIVSIVFSLPAIILVSLFISWIFKPTAHELGSNKDVIAYLEQKYSGESFEILSKNDDTWQVKSNTSGITFTVKETYDSHPGSGGLTPGEYVATDEYITAALDARTKKFSSNYFTLKHEPYYSLHLYDGDNLLDVSDLDYNTKSDIERLCRDIANDYPFISMSADQKKRIDIFLQHKLVRNETGSRDYYHCDISTATVEEFQD